MTFHSFNRANREVIYWDIFQGTFYVVLYCWLAYSGFLAHGHLQYDNSSLLSLMT